MKALATLCVGLTLAIFPANAARLALPPVPHYGIEPLPLPQPAAPPRYTEHYDQSETARNTENNKSDNRKSLWERITDDAVAFVTLCLVAVTGVLAFSTVGLWIVTAHASKRQSKDMKASIDKLGEAAEISQKQFLISARQTDIIEKQHAIGRMQFISTHRPLLRVRYFRRIDISDLKVRINFTIINVGSSQANLLGSYGRLGFFARDNLPPPFYEGAPEVIEPRKFEPGATDEGIILHTRDPNVASILHVYGILVYEDIFNNTRTTAFCRRYNVSTKRFDLVKDSDYEYED